MRLAADVARRLAFRALSALEGGEVVLRYPDGLGRRFGDGNGPSFTVHVRDPEALWRKLGTKTRVGFGESYVDGDWDCDDLVGLFSLLGRNLETAGSHPVLQRLYRLQELRPDRRPRQTVEAAKDSIHAHYDLGNDLFELMLDPTMTYSCAYWERPGMTLEEGQRAKIRHICEKIRLGPDDHVLEIGCGWGGFAIQAATEVGCRVTGLTLSPSQARLARERVAAAGLDDLVEIREQDYRLTRGRFSRIVSIEMFEAIGLAEYENYFAAVDRLLTPGRRRLHPDDRRARLALRALPPPARLDPAGDLPRLAPAVARGDREGGRHHPPPGQRGGGDRVRLRPDAARVAAERRAQRRPDPRARVRRALPPALALLPHLLRGRLRDPVAARHAARAQPLRERRAARVPAVRPAY